MPNQDSHPGFFRLILRRPGLIVLLALWLLGSIVLKCDCNCCVPDVKVEPSRKTGQVQILVNNLGVLFQGETVYETVSYSGRLVGSSDQDRGRSNFQFQRTVEITSASFNAPIESRRNLKPGTWEVTVNCRGWQASGTGEVRQGGTTQFTFTYNRPGCTVK
jgi:hypothetical protein